MPLDGTLGASQDPAVINLQTRHFIINNSIDVWVPIAQGTITTGVGSIVNVGLRPFGLAKRLLIEIHAPVTPSAQNQTLGPFGPAALLSNVTLQDTSTQTRINTPGWHLHAVSTAKRRRVFGSATTTDTPFGYGNNVTNVMSAPATLTGGAGASNVNAVFEVPISYTDADLRGAIWLGVTNANANLSFTLNPNMFAISTTTDATQALYKSAGAGAATLGTVTYTVHYNCLDQLPRIPAGQQNAGAVILPYGDLGVAYIMLTSPFGAIVANSDNPFFYPNFRDIMSTIIIYNQNGTLNPGTDISYFALQSANFTNVFKYPATISALLTRMIIGDDPPAGMYYFDHRHKPINTLQYGNMALLVNPTSAAASTSVLFALEQLAQIGQVVMSGSMPGT